MKSKQVQEFKETEIGKIPIDWAIEKLQDHLIIKGRIGWKGLKTSEYTDSGPFIVGGLQIIENKVVWEKCAHVTDERYNESPEIMLRESDILMTKDGTIGKLAFIENITHKATVASHIHVIRKNSDKVLPLFLFYFFKSTRFQNLIQSKITGSVVPALTQKDINNTTFPIPPIHEQKSISEFLYSLYKKIENLQTQNKILEQTAQAIFKSWFVDFDGHTEFEDSELGKIPKGWSVKQIKEILGEKGYIRGPFGSSLKRADLKSEGIPVYEQQHIIHNHRNFRFFIDDEKFKKMSRFTVKENDILISCSGTVGKVTTIKPDDPKGIISQALLILRPDTKLTSPRFLEYFLRSNNGYKAITSSSSGSVQINLARREIIQSITLIHPEKNLLKKFQDIINKIDNSLAHNAALVISLTKTRDALLPKLMSGEIRV